MHEGSTYAVTPAEAKVMKILFATDDSEFSKEALRFLIEQVRPHETEVRVLNVVEPLPLLVVREMGGYDPALESLWEARNEQAEELVTKIAETLRTKGMKVSTTVAQGDPKSKILDVAEQWKAELIVLGSHGQTSLEHFLMGSVSDAVARHARCSVKVVRIRSLR